ncbi:MAG: mercury(II) reductase [Desulfobacteraceae bacterium 4572_123]|nr:MAG: mercury(II) reductase [Desulfobacteraceae bacterium 4572_123]
MKVFDLIIIGGGAGAVAAAIHAHELNAQTAMINTGLPLGGTCVNVGCVPSKRLLHAGQLLYQAGNHGIPGIELAVSNFDFRALVEDELNLVARMRQQKYEKVLAGLKTVTFIEGRAKLISPTQVRVNGQTLQAEKMIIATGSKATAPPIAGLAQTGYVTHIEALQLLRLPEKLVIIGAGPVAIEFAQMFSRFGSRVTIVKRSPGILRFAEPLLTERLAQILTGEGIDIITAQVFRNARVENNQKVLAVTVDGSDTQIAADEILVAAGKTPNTKGLGLDAAGVEIDARGAVVVNATFQTSRPHIFAVGDVTAQPARLEPTAGKEGTLAAGNALTGATDRIDYDTVPFTVFTDPQLAGVGLTEADQMQRLGTCNCRTVSFENVPRAILMNRTEGLINMTIDPSTEKIMGVHILAPDAGELIAAAMVLVKNKNTIDDVIKSLPMFPTLAEALKIVALSFKKDISSLSCCV